MHAQASALEQTAEQMREELRRLQELCSTKTAYVSELDAKMARVAAEQDDCVQSIQQLQRSEEEAQQERQALMEQLQSGKKHKEAYQLLLGWDHIVPHPIQQHAEPEAAVRVPEPPTAADRITRLKLQLSQVQSETVEPQSEMKPALTQDAPQAGTTGRLKPYFSMQHQLDGSSEATYLAPTSKQTSRFGLEPSANQPKPPEPLHGHFTVPDSGVPTTSSQVYQDNVNGYAWLPSTTLRPRPEPPKQDPPKDEFWMLSSKVDRKERIAHLKHGLDEIDPAKSVESLKKVVMGEYTEVPYGIGRWST